MDNKKLSKIKCLCFDIDGTLYDLRVMRKTMFKKLILSLFSKNITFKEICILNCYRKTLEAFRNGVEITNKSLSQLHTSSVSEKMHCTSEMINQVVGKWMTDVPCDKIHNYVWPDMKNTLVKLKDKGYHLAVLSDYPAKEKVNAMGLDGIFEAILSCQDLDSNGYKPNTNGFRKIAKHFDLNPCECIYIGDSYERDIRGAIENQMHAILLNPYIETIKEQPHEFMIINKFSDLLRVLP
ncbi:MAG: HAD family hydrolase [Candidatus Omnitrophica bacterium]|nr:HAD family hydrolase [Candidatus Omnitrophota bacterium]